MSATRALAKDTTQENRADHPVVRHLQRQVANAFVLYANYKHYHWQTFGPLFRDLHLMFDEFAKQVLETTDDMAERIRMIGQDVDNVQLKQMQEAAKRSRVRARSIHARDDRRGRRKFARGDQRHAGGGQDRRRQQRPWNRGPVLEDCSDPRKTGVVPAAGIEEEGRVGQLTSLVSTRAGRRCGGGIGLPWLVGLCSPERPRSRWRGLLRPVAARAAAPHHTDFILIISPRSVAFQSWVER